MKLRIQGNSLRLRLKRSEVAAFASQGFVEECIEFADSSLRYRLERSGVDRLSAYFEPGVIRVEVPAGLGQDWTETDVVGMERVDSSPTILIEKDFTCAHGNKAEEADSYPNPFETASAEGARA